MDIETNKDDMDSKTTANGSWRPLLFVAVYYLMTIFSVVVHFWVTARGWSEDGAWWGVAYFLCFIYAEVYWAYQAFQTDGITFFVVATSLCGCWWIVLLLFKKKLQKCIVNDDEI